MNLCQTTIQCIALAALLVAGCGTNQATDQAASRQPAAAMQTTYPPYPAVWDRFSEVPQASIGLLNFRTLPNGDVLISTYATREHHLAFFSGAGFASLEEAFGSKPKSPEDRRDVELQNGIHISAI